MPKPAAPSSTVEDYLKRILLLSQEPGDAPVGMGDIATSLGVAPGTVTAMMKTLAEAGLVSYEPYSGVRLTEAGRKLATHVLRRHRLVELFLVEVMALDWSEVHAEAELLEHAVSDRLIERMDEMLGRPSVDPHGDPIPDAAGHLEDVERRSLSSCPAGRSRRVTRVGDQSAEFLRLLDRVGVQPGVEVTVVERDEAADALRLRVGDDAADVTLGLRAAAKIYVA